MAKKGAEVGLSIPKPCGAEWDEMAGQGAVRHCASCDKDVHHLSMMRREDAHDLIESRGEGRLCVRYFVGDDGDILFADDELPNGASTRLYAQLSGARRLLAAAALAAPLLLAACDVAPTPAAQAPLVIEEGKPVQLAPTEEPGAARPPAFAQPVESPAAVEVEGEIAMPAEVDGDMVMQEETDGEGCDGGAEPDAAKPLPRYKHKGALPPKDTKNLRVVKGDVAVEHE